MWYKTWKLFLLQIQIPKSIDRNSNLVFLPSRRNTQIKNKTKEQPKKPPNQNQQKPPNENKIKQKKPQHFGFKAFPTF